MLQVGGAVVIMSGKPAAKPAATASGKVDKSELKKRARAVAYRKKAKPSAAKEIAKKPSAKKAAPAAGLAAPVSRFYSADDAATPLTTRKKTVTAPLKAQYTRVRSLSSSPAASAASVPSS